MTIIKKKYHFDFFFSKKIPSDFSKQYSNSLSSYLTFHLWTSTSQYVLIWILHLLQVMSCHFLLKMEMEWENGMKKMEFFSLKKNFFFLAISKNQTMVRNSEAGFLLMLLESISTLIIPLTSPFPLKFSVHNSIFLPKFVNLDSYPES